MNKNINLNYEEIPSELFSFNEVLELNSVDNLDVKFGIIDGSYIAIIGLPFSSVEFDTLTIEDMIYEFMPIDDKNAKNNYYIVYPYNNNFFENKPLIEKVDEILNTRAVIMYNNVYIKER